MTPQYLCRQILLLHIMIRIIVGIFISHTMSQLGCPFVMGILEMGRYG